MGICSASDLGLSDPIEVVLLVCYVISCKEGGGSGGHSLWVVKSKPGSVKWCVIGPQLSKELATGFTIFCIRECIPPFFIS